MKLALAVGSVLMVLAMVAACAEQKPPMQPDGPEMAALADAGDEPPPPAPAPSAAP